LGADSNILNDYIGLMKILGGNNDSDDLSKKHFESAFEQFRKCLDPRHTFLLLEYDNTVLYPIPFASTGSKPNLVILGINPGLSKGLIVKEKKLAGSTYSDYAKSYCFGPMIEHATIKQKSTYYTQKVLPIALSLRMKQTVLYRDFKKKLAKNFPGTLGGFHFMTAECVPFHSENFPVTRKTEILNHPIHQEYSSRLLDVIDKRITHGGTLFLLFTPRTFFCEDTHLVGIYRRHYLPQLKYIDLAKKYVFATIDIDGKRVMLIACRYSDRYGVNSKEEKDRFWLDVFNYRLKHIDR